MTTNYKPQKEIYAPLPCWGWNIKWVSNIRLIFLTGNCKADLYFSIKKIIMWITVDKMKLQKALLKDYYEQLPILSQILRVFPLILN